MPSKNTLFSTLGTTVEYFDFVIYGMLTDILSKIFFSEVNISGYFTFALGYIARPIGAVIFGSIADNFGRKMSLTSSILLISISTLCIGLINVDMLGWQLLIALRLLQGIAFGAEMSNAVIISIESSKSKSLEHGFVLSGSALGSIIGSLSCFYLFTFFDKKEILNYAWRFPFIFAGIISIVCYFLRKNLSESIKIEDLYGENKQNNIIKSSLGNLVKFFPQIALSAIVITLPAIMIIANLHLPSVMQDLMGLNRSSVHFDSMMGIAVMMFFNPFIQELSRLNVYVLFMIFPGLALLAYMSILQSNTLFFFIFFQAIISMLMVFLFKIVVYSFPPYFRVTGMSIAYNIAFIAASFFPILLKNTEMLNAMNIITYAILFGLSFITIFIKSKQSGYV